MLTVDTDRSQRAGVTVASPARRRVARSGVWPALAAWGSAGALGVGVAGLRPIDLLAFTAYVVGFLTVPGLLLWRRLAADADRLLLVDLVLGTLLGLALSVPVHLAAVAVGVPLLALAWPVLVVGWAAGTRAGRRLWYRGRPMPPRWAWATALLLGFAAAEVAMTRWSASPLWALRAPHVDEAFHLALTGELRHHVPSQMPWVDGVPLYYHWLVYAHLGSAANLTGIEPIVLLRVLSSALWVTLTLLGALAAGRRLTGRWWPGFLAAAMLVLGGSTNFLGWMPTDALLPTLLYSLTLPLRSPTHGFATAVVVPLLVLLVEALRANRLTPSSWGLVAFLMLVVAGAKATTLPPLLAGLALAVLVQAVLRTGRLRVPVVLLGTATAAFLLAQQVFYGGGSRALELDPLRLATWSALRQGILGSEEQATYPVLAVVTATWLLALALATIGVVGMLPDRGWREPDHQFLVGAVAAAVGAAFAFGHPGTSQYFFLAGAAPLLAVVSALGLARLLPERGRRRGCTTVLLAAGAAGLVTTAVVRAVTTERAPIPDDAWGETVRAVLVPDAIGTLVLVAVAVGAAMLVRRWASRRLAVAAAAAVLLGSCFVRPFPMAARFVGAGDPWPDPPPPTGAIGERGVEAARALRAMSEPDDLVATNAHCYRLPAPDCERINFWIAGYAERRVLVEGWAYVDPVVVGLPSNAETNSSTLDFWDPERLAANDRVFERPTEQAVTELRDEYGVEWLFADTRYPVKLEQLARVAERVGAAGDYVIFRLPDD